MKANVMVFKGAYHTCQIKVVGKVDLNVVNKIKNIHIAISDSLCDKLTSLMENGEDMHFFGGVWHCKLHAGSAMHKEIISLLETEKGLHRKTLNAVRNAYSKAHVARVAFANGCVRIISKIAHKIETAFEKLFCYDVRSGRMVNLQEA